MPKIQHGSDGKYTITIPKDIVESAQNQEAMVKQIEDFLHDISLV